MPTLQKWASTTFGYADEGFVGSPAFLWNISLECHESSDDVDNAFVDNLIGQLA